jgi:alkylated DNA repair dioxygenase AlkB
MASFPLKRGREDGSKVNPPPKRTKRPTKWMSADGEDAFNQGGVDFIIKSGFVPDDLKKRVIKQLRGEHLVPRIGRPGMFRVKKPETVNFYAYLADTSADECSNIFYGFSNNHLNPLQAKPLVGALKELAELVYTEVGMHVKDENHVNVVLVNFYTDGESTLSYHSDDDVQNVRIDGNQTIASVTFNGGDPRTFVIKPNDANLPTIRANLGDGSLAVMRGKTQEVSKHGIPAMGTKAKPVGWRVNLPFRTIDTRKIPKCTPDEDAVAIGNTLGGLMHEVNTLEKRKAKYRLAGLIPDALGQ